MGAGRLAPGGGRIGRVAAAGALGASVALAAAAAGAAAPKPPTGPAASYCRAQGGTPQTRTPAFGTNNPGSLALNGSLGFCKFRSSNGSSIFVDLRTLTSTRPTLAALAYLAYHANGVVRGKDLTKVLRYRPTSPPAVFS
jgi:hypothetical protein